jgi:hypothetical protein
MTSGPIPSAPMAAMRWRVGADLAVVGTYLAKIAKAKSDERKRKRPAISCEPFSMAY